MVRPNSTQSQQPNVNRWHFAFFINANVRPKSTVSLSSPNTDFHVDHGSTPKGQYRHFNPPTLRQRNKPFNDIAPCFFQYCDWKNPKNETQELRLKESQPEKHSFRNQANEIRSWQAGGSNPCSANQEHLTTCTIPPRRISYPVRVAGGVPRALKTSSKRRRKSSSIKTPRMLSRRRNRNPVWARPLELVTVNVLLPVILTTRYTPR